MQAVQGTRCTSDLPASIGSAASIPGSCSARAEHACLVFFWAAASASLLGIAGECIQILQLLLRAGDWTRVGQFRQAVTL